MFGGAGLVFLFGAGLLGLSGTGGAGRLLASAHGPWSLPASVGIFAILAFLGFPQFILIAAAIAVYGVWRGAAYSWVGTMVSALIGFWLGHAWGARVIDQIPGDKLRRFLALISRNGFIASLAVRLTPFAPFVIVNMAAGVSRIGLGDFVAGTALGIVPKILLTAFAGSAIVRGLGGGGLAPILLLLLAVAVWIISGVMAGRWLRR